MLNKRLGADQWDFSDRPVCREVMGWRLCAAQKLPFPLSHLLITTHLPFFFVLSSPKARESNIHAASEADLPPKHGV